MTRAARARNRWGDTDLVAVFEKAEEFSKSFVQGLHGSKHREHIVVYTSKQTLDTNAGTEFYSPYSGEIKWVKASLAGAPTSQFKLDLLLDGNSVFDTDFLTIESGDKWSYTAYPNMLGVRGLEDPEPTPLKFKIDTLSAAVGPMVCYIGIQVEDS